MCWKDDFKVIYYYVNRSVRYYLLEYSSVLLRIESKILEKSVVCFAI